VFGSLAEASRFFERGSLGYSKTMRDGEYDGLELKTFGWRVEPLEVTEIASSYFDDGSRFPAGTIQFDHAGIWLFPVRVICLRLFPSRPIVNTCVLPLRVDVKAICRPFAEYEGRSLEPSPNVIWRV